LHSEKKLLAILKKSDLLTRDAQEVVKEALRLPYIRKRCAEIEMTNSSEGTSAISELAQLHENSRKALKTKKLSVKQKCDLKKELTHNLTPAAARSITGNSRYTIWRQNKQPPTCLQAHETYEMLECSVAETKEKETVVYVLENMYCGFFEGNTGVYSGSDNDIRNMEMAKSTMACLLYAQLPRMYRELAISQPEWVQNLKKSESRVYKGIQEAIKRQNDEGFNAVHEEEIRMRMAMARYKKKLLDKRLSNNRGIMPAKLPAEETEHIYSEQEYEMEDEIFPVADRTFFRLLKKKGVRWRTNAKPYVCPVCLDGPSDAVVLQNILNEMGAIKFEQKQLKSSDDETDGARKEVLRCKLAGLSSQQQRLFAKQEEYKAHLKQFAVCRPYVDEKIKKLSPGECLLFRDFVNQYASDGVKIGNLQLVVLYRLKEGGLVRTLKVSNFHRRPTTDWFFVRDVMDFHLKGKANGGSGLFDQFTQIYISGDHGSHFSAKQNIYFESTIFELYAKTVLLLFLCSYHCYNRCDAAGVYSKVLSTAAAREKKVLVESADYAMALMEDASCDTLGYDFKEINRNMLILEAELKDPPKHVILRKMCEFVFLGPGVFKCRRVPGEGKFIFLDIRPTTADNIEFFCYHCSELKQEQTYHGSSVCPDSAAERFKTEEDSVANNIDKKASPANDVKRKCMLKGKQMNKKMKERMSAEQRFREKPFPCRCCDLKRYAKSRGANKHMTDVHLVLEGDHRLYPSDPPRTAKVTKGKSGSKAGKSDRTVVEEFMDRVIDDQMAVQVPDEEEFEAAVKAGAVATEAKVVIQVEPIVETGTVAVGAQVAVKVPISRERFARSCNKGVVGIVEGSESESSSESEESSSTSESEEESDSESKN
jgi:hypothetical protein